jgi:H+/Cl- antiporter ClcA
MEQNVNQLQEKEPNIFKWAFKFAASAGIAGILCCVAPAVLFMFGLMGGIYAISFADFFYAEDGSVGLGSWILRGAAVLIGAYGIYLFRKKQNQCSIDPKRKRKNLILVAIITVILGIAIFLTLEKWSSWYFDKHIVPAQQEEYQPMDLEKSAN